MHRTDFWTLWEKARVGCFKRTASKHVYYLVKQITSPGWMHETSARTCALGRPRGIGWRGRWEGGSGWGTHVNPWLIHFNVWQNPLKYCKVISLQLIKKEKKKKNTGLDYQHFSASFHVGAGPLFPHLQNGMIMVSAVIMTIKWHCLWWEQSLVHCRQSINTT